MKHTILIVDDEKIQAESLQKVFHKERSHLHVKIATQESEITNCIENLYFNVAIVDLRMDDFSISGFDIIKRIINLNPFAKIIIQSAFLPEYSEDIKDIYLSGKIAAIVDKTKYDIFKVKILEEVDKIINAFEDNPKMYQKSLEGLYADAKNETETYSKGSKFEQFVSILLAQMGFIHITRRVRDKSLNEIDLIIRNEINDMFFQKFSPYILVECKNSEEKVDKNNFIQFLHKVENTNGLSNLGVLITSSALKRNTYIEAVRTSKTSTKIVFLSNIEINKLIYSKDMLEEFKSIIDEQVKDN